MGRGGARTGAGRPHGAKNRSTKKQEMTLSELAKGYAPEALEMLAEVMRYGVSDSARVAASIAILDRGYGRPKPLESEPASTEIGDWIREIQAKGSKPTLASEFRFHAECRRKLTNIKNGLPKRVINCVSK